MNSTMNRHVKILALAVLTLAVTACGGGSPSTTPSSPPTVAAPNPTVPAAATTPGVSKGTMASTTTGQSAAVVALTGTDGHSLWMTTDGRLRPGESEIMVAPQQAISFSRADASQLAQAKAANACGQRILLRRMGITADQVDHVYLAGGFANAIDVENAIAIGMLADVRPETVIRAGNAALRGAEALLLSARRRAHLEHIVRRIEHVELETDPDFFDMFVDGCQFQPIAA